MTGQSPPSWHPDPFRRHQLRYWDGIQWTHHVASHGCQSVDPPIAGPPGGAAVPPVPPQVASVLPAVPRQPVAPRPPVAQGSRKVQRQVKRAGVEPGNKAGGGSLLTEPVLVVNQKAKLIGANTEYAVFSQVGQRIGTVREVGQSVVRNAIGIQLSNNARSHRFQILDHDGRMLLMLARPATLARSTLIVRYPNGAEAGRIVQKNLGIIGKVRFELVAGTRVLGSIHAEGWNVWDFSMLDAQGDEVARITKSGLSRAGSKERDKYVVQMHRPLEEPLRALVIASSLAVDTALRQH